ncbi:anthranilate synthase component I family protein [Asticcacaulis sp. AND118]|uniref:anthranilate synthase component I family protein n=1 Tax=Asticcacaulis sp. AND118 TaxID=2840468 RepID=UPI001CFFD3A4|nr:anthranilate synthase component I family protein [Asticcacaulis sp. AND118]UDF03757.1 anthranilate synthase component I family protein [Asticcacaulis sp. AND118]
MPDHLHILSLPFRPPEAFFGTLLTQAACAGFLSDGGKLGRWSWLCAGPETVDRFAFDDPRPVDAVLRQACDGARRDATVTTGDTSGERPPFTGGLIGLAAFELGLRLENLPLRPFRLGGAPWPELVLMSFATVLAFDLHERRLLALGRGPTADIARQRAETLAARSTTATTAPPPAALMDAPLLSETPDAEFEAKVARLVAQIHAGDLFQANLARGWTGRLNAGITPDHVLRALDHAGASPFGAFVRFGDRAVVSNSPERFIRLGADGRMETRPIKGTRPRGSTSQDDTALGDELLTSAKDRAENLMIVDLMRHDLSKVAEVGSVRVEALNALESYPNVHHLVSTITAQLKPGHDAADVLLATFPPGSISGAPKVQAMKVIQALEAPRGPYCGSLFWVDASGAMDSNVLIRTAACERDADGRWRLRVAAGGGIVADSDPADERRETETKLSLLRRVLEGGPYFIATTPPERG